MSDIVVNGDRSVFNLIPAMPQEQQGWECFESPEAMVAFIKAVPRSQYWEDDGYTNSDRFAGCSVAKAFEYAADGWQEGAERVARLRDRILAHAPKKLRITAYHHAGGIVDVPRFLAGEIKCMKRHHMVTNRSRPIITLINSGSGSAFIEANVFVNRAAVVAAIVDVVEAAGYSVHVIDLDVSANRRYLFGKAVTVKEPGAVPDIARMAFALGHPGMFRRFGFMCRGYNAQHEPIGRGFGYPVSVPTGTEAFTYILPNSNEVRSVFDSERVAEEAGLSKFIEILRAQGCPAFREEEDG